MTLPIPVEIDPTTGAGGGIAKAPNAQEPSQPISLKSEIPRPIRTRDFGFLPIPKNRRHDPSRNAHEQFGFSMKMNLLLAAAAVSPRESNSFSWSGAGADAGRPYRSLIYIISK